MNRKQLLAVFPNGNTVHVPSDGKPLPGYKQAMASYKKRRSASEIQVANASSRSSGGGKTLLAMLFSGGGGGDSAEATAAPARAAPRAKTAPAVAVASAVPQSRPSLPGGVTMPVGDRFDTGAPANGRTKEAGTAVAALDDARIPVPSWAPARATPRTPASASPAGPPSSPSDAVSTLVAALEAQAAETVTGGQLAYAVPTPRDRPMFDNLLATDKGSSAKTSDAVGSLVAAVTPRSRPTIDPKAARPATAMMTAAASALPIPAPTRSSVAPVLQSDGTASDNSVKGGRVVRVAARPAPKAVRIDPQEAIASRIEIASLVAGSELRAQRLSRPQPDTGRLVGDLPRTLFAEGFTPASTTGKTDRFSGSAVNFLPLVKLEQ